MPTPLIRSRSILALAALFLAVGPLHQPGIAASPRPPAIGMRSSLDDLHYELWSRGLAPAFSADQSFDYLVRLVADTIDPNQWQNMGTEGFLKPHRSTICGGKRDPARVRSASPP